MPFYRSIRSRKVRKRISPAFELQLTSMLDVLVIILVFLLKSIASSPTNFVSVPGVQLPVSRSPDVPPDSLSLVITPVAMMFEEARIVDFSQSADSLGGEARYSFRKENLSPDGRTILPLFDALIKAKEKSEVLRAKSPKRTEKGEPFPFDGVLALQADKKVNYDILRRVMYTAGTAGYKVFRFLAAKKETE